MNTLRPHHETLEIPELEIQKEAHRLWIEKGRPEGCDLETWLEAKELLKHRPAHDIVDGRAAPTQIHFPPAHETQKPAAKQPRHRSLRN